MKTKNWIQQADQAIKRAAVRARDVAASTHTPIHVMKDGKMIKVMPAAKPASPESCAHAKGRPTTVRQNA